MPIVRIIDGTRDVMYGKAVLPALGEIAKYQTLSIRGPQPGSYDLAGYNAIKRAEIAAYNSSREQVDATKLALTVINDLQVEYRDGIDTIILSEMDFFGARTNWQYGSARRDGRNNGVLVISTYRLQDIGAFTHVVTHELGHLYGAAPDGRRNTEGNLGSHCTNLCIMQQKVEESEMLARVRQISSCRDKFCAQCRQDLRYFLHPV